MTGEAKSRWDTLTEWQDIPAEITAGKEDTQHGNLEAVYDYLREYICAIIPEYDVIVDLSMGTPLTLLALIRLVEDYSLTAIHVENYEEEKARTIQYYPRGVGSDPW